jgi:hypothetical protein
MLDDAVPVTGSSSGTTLSLDITSEVYLGGHEDYTAVKIGFLRETISLKQMLSFLSGERSRRCFERILWLYQ